MIKFLKYFFYFISIFVLILIFYRLFKHKNLFEISSHIYYTKYYLLSVSIFIFGYISKYIKENLYIGICLIFFSFGIIIYSIEATLNYLEILKRGGDKRSIIQVYKDQKKIDKNVSITLPPSVFINRKYDLLPLSHLRNTLIIDCNELGYYSMNMSDKHGFNNDSKNWDLKIDYLIVGDSFSYGQCVFRKNNIASIIASSKKKNVLNLSMPGNGILLNFATLKEYLPLIKVDNLIWFINDMDFLNLKNENNNLILQKYLLNKEFTQNLKSRKEEESLVIKDLFKKRYNKIIFQKFLVLNKTRLFINERLKLINKKTFDKIDYTKNLEKLTNLIFNNLGDLIDKNINIYLVHVPVKNKFIDKSYNSKFKNISKNLAKKSGFEFIDLETIIIADDNPLALFSDNYGHYNEKGYEVISKYILEELN